MARRGERLGPTRAEVLHQLRETEAAMSSDEVAERLGLHSNTTRFHLDALVEAGLVSRESEPRDTPGRPRVLYRAVAVHTPNRYQELAFAMARHFAPDAANREELARQAGQAWGTELLADKAASEPLERVVDTLNDLGYEPDVTLEPDPVVRMRPCPQADIDSAEQSVVCQLHLGLIQGLLGPDQAQFSVEIQPWVTPTLCLARLRPDPPAEGATNA